MVSFSFYLLKNLELVLGQYLLSRVGAWDSTTGLRVPYLDIPKAVRNPLVANLGLTPLDGYLNVVELPLLDHLITVPPKQDYSVAGVGFSCRSAEKVSRAFLAPSEHRKNPIIVCCSGTSVQFLKVV